MVQIRLTNTKTRRKEDFRPIDPENVRFYLCGPTVYDRAHLGNARPVVVFDVLVRLLRHVYGADHVTYVRNFTDVDDKINAAALARQQAGAPGTLEELIRERTQETIGWYHADMDALGAARPDHEPRATDYIDQMIAMIEKLIAEGHAYARDGHALFRVRSYADYGKLSGRSVDDMIAGARVEVAPFKEDPMDFVLWKPSDAGLPGWESPWGRGRPGWHIECSAMAHELLGESFDIHAGGIDLQFPHHENEIAQSACAHPHGEFARVWLHNEMLQVEGKKMSKSLGNFFTVRDLLDQGIPGEVIRFVFLQTHYRKPMDWTEEKRIAAVGRLSKWDELKRRSLSDPERAFDGSMVDHAVIDALADDLNTPEVLTRLYAMQTEVMLARKPDSEIALSFFDTLQFLGFSNLDTQRLLRKQAVEKAADKVNLVETLLQARSDARQARDFSRADAIRDALVAAGVEINDTAEGSSWSFAPNFDADRLKDVI
ncbi:cysteinyl-tRNA synthetase [Paracoccus halophilus]|uniref:Cysteine--tRNA ligase n=1 Tax=Paracoccus halophilus TaxID=376733 RepID=A0A099F7E2_9RHOB|nr:cysteine--tRNA ligase [Paracoccus halophilus]KGJ06168.1 cysteinyl-tRNA synthetase [Paracoccus halophilus]SFA45962.1 cysteinyl-tRNA synthetase [Paracoccus halophilus]